jgi:flagellar protein FlgJ
MPSIRRGFDAAASPAAGGGAAANPAAKSAGRGCGGGRGPLAQLPAGAGPRAFVEKVWPQAVEASRATGIPARFLVAQAALETGWGKYELKNADGSPSHNLFNIKAGKRWAATR